MRKLWKICKLFSIPINDERIQTMTEEQVDFMLWSSLLDDPKAVSKLDNTYYDPEYDDALDNLEETKETETYSHRILQKFDLSDDIKPKVDNLLGKETEHEIEQNNYNDEEWEEV